MTVLAKQNDAWKEIEKIWTKSEGEWLLTERMHGMDNGVWKLIFPDILIFTLTDSTDIGLLNWLVSQGALPNYHIVVNIPVDNYIGGTIHGKPALNIGAGAETTYKSLTINVHGHIQGRGGKDSEGSHGIISQSEIHVHVHSTGTITAGGGAGGDGGKGGDGYKIIWGSWHNSFGAPRYRWDQEIYTRGEENCLEINWNDKDIMPGHGTSPCPGIGERYHKAVPEGQDDFYEYGGYVYQRAKTMRWDNRFWDIRRGTKLTQAGNGGAAGQGGNGRGYIQTRTDGTKGGQGYNGSGKGGDGGNGATWGDGGTQGATGADGNSTAGKAGQEGHGPGKAITSSKEVFLTNEGTISGEVTRDYVAGLDT